MSIAAAPKSIVDTFEPAIVVRDLSGCDSRIVLVTFCDRS